MGGSGTLFLKNGWGGLFFLKNGLELVRVAESGWGGLGVAGSR